MEIGGLEIEDIGDLRLAEAEESSLDLGGGGEN
jgi:hypothetical protein